jgi:hypothetical protein
VWLLVKLQKRLKDWRIFSLAIAVCLSANETMLAAFCENATPAYLFKQKSQIQGQADLLVSALGVKMSLTDRHLVIYMRPPLWHVQYCDLRSKRYFECAKEQFKEPLARTVNMTKASSFSHLKVKSSKPTVFMGAACKQFELFDPYPTEGKRDQTWQALSIRSALACGYDEGQTKTLGRVLCRVYGMPELDAVPLNILVTNYRGENSTELETSTAKKVTVNAADFVVPATCVQVPTVTAVASENDVDSSLTELFK